MYMEIQGTQSSQTILKKAKLKDKIFNFKTCYKAIVIETVWYLT